MTARLLVALCAVHFLSCNHRNEGAGGGPPREGIELKDPCAFPANAGDDVGVTYINILNHGPEDDRLVGAHTSVAETVETHETIAEDGIVMMRHREDGFAIPAGGSLVMEPGGAHLMLMRMKSELVKDSTYEITLQFEKAGTMKLAVPINFDLR